VRRGGITGPTAPPLKWKLSLRGTVQRGSSSEKKLSQTHSRTKGIWEKEDNSGSPKEFAPLRGEVLARKGTSGRSKSSHNWPTSP